jgi:hypothetical protein
LVGVDAASLSLSPTLVRAALEAAHLDWGDRRLRLFSRFENLLIIYPGKKQDKLLEARSHRYFQRVLRRRLPTKTIGRDLMLAEAYEPETRSQGQVAIRFRSPLSDQEFEAEPASPLRALGKALLFLLGGLVLQPALAHDFTVSLGNPWLNAAATLLFPVLGFLMGLLIARQVTNPIVPWPPDNAIFMLEQRLDIWREQGYRWPALLVTFIPLIFLQLHWILHATGLFRVGRIAFNGPGLLNSALGFVLAVLIGNLLGSLFIRVRKYAIVQEGFREPLGLLRWEKISRVVVDSERLELQVVGSSLAVYPCRILYGFENHQDFERVRSFLQKMVPAKDPTGWDLSHVVFYVAVLIVCIFETGIINSLSLNVPPSQTIFWGMLLVYLCSRIYNRYTGNLRPTRPARTREQTESKPGPDAVVEKAGSGDAAATEESSARVVSPPEDTENKVP